MKITKAIWNSRWGGLVPAVFIWMSGVSAQETKELVAGDEANVGGVEVLVQEVLDKNPQLKAARLRWQSLQEQPEIAEALPDPMLTYGHFFANVETRVGAMNQKVGVSQKIPFPGKRSLAAEKARQEALVAMWEYQSLARQLIREVKTAYYDLYRIRRSVDILRSELELLEPIIASVAAKYEAGTVPQQDLLKAQLQYDRVESRVLDTLEMEEGVVARINALRDVPVERELAVAGELDLPSVPELQQMFSLAEEYRQELKAAGVAIEKDETALALAKKQKWPDFNLGIEYTQINDNNFSDPPDNGQDAVMGFVSINVPVWFGKYRAMERKAEKQLSATRRMESNAQNEVMSKVQETWSRARFNRQQVRLYRRQLVPRAMQTFRSGQAGYEAGTVDFIDLLDSERALLSLRLGLVISESELAKALADLERSIGVDLQAVPQEEKE